MTEIIYLLTTLYAAYVIDDIIGDMHLFVYAVFLIIMHLISLHI